jgi:hypothetical protein
MMVHERLTFAHGEHVGLWSIVRVLWVAMDGDTLERRHNCEIGVVECLESGL